ncbi:MAG: tRNA (adenosine(37)-N6)-threonylcarbamoyltransferase complex dimerization subunit type 1 TsaB [Deltaproteobacteria bacterium]|nr:tRNA (adenosine(37)-N6)-threonylcarbamoyltransferase complex dimerization subunit type 1 TsaB [Candidatus Zymogenaceae bacterium]
MIVLGVDSATPRAGVGIVEDGRLCARRVTLPDKNHSETLLSAIIEALREARLAFSDLDLLAVGLGPGSFTALRVGVSTMKALSYAHDVPLIGISTLDVLAGGLLEYAEGLKTAGTAVSTTSWRDMMRGGARVASVIDARRGELYSASYRLGEGDGLVRETPYRTITPGVLLDELKEPSVLVGSGCDLLERPHDRGHVVVPEEYRHPDGAVCAEMARRGFESGQLIDDRDIVPLYIRRSDAEINYERRMNKDLSLGH